MLQFSKRCIREESRAIRFIQVGEGLSEVFAALSTRQFEDILSPFGCDLISSIHVIDKISTVSWPPLEFRCRHRKKRRELAES